ncbi:MAG: hypothetical protein WCP39_07165 [Chlamydiota bacterium]
MRAVPIMIFTIVAAFMGFFVWKNYPEVYAWAKDTIFFSKISTLELRYTAEAIMKDHKKELLADKNHSFLEADLEFHPYLLMEVKYNRTKDKTAEGVILWSLMDGEMVLDTKSWEKSHGFFDCLEARADREDFKVINALAKHGSMDIEDLAKKLRVEPDVLQIWLEKSRKKNLIVQSGNEYRLHLQNPKLLMIPETKIGQWFVSKASKVTNRLARRYRAAQVISIAKSAFGLDFTIRKTTEVFLPVHRIAVQNPDGSEMMTYWNALNGQKFSQTYHME